jgi:hypothetical protein
MMNLFLFLIAIITLAVSIKSTTTQAQYAACLAKPNADCLFEQAYKNLQFESSHKATYANGFGRATLATGYPEWTVKAMTEALSETRGFSFPNPHFAEPASLKAQAELALELNQDAQQSTETAFKNAFTEHKGYSVSCCDAISSTIPLILLNQKSVSIDKIKAFYQFSANNKVPKALAIVENSAIALARQGKIEDALRLADEFFPQKNPSTPLQVDKTKEYENAYESNRRSYLLAIIALAEGQIKRKDLSAAQATLNDIEKLELFYAKESNYAEDSEIAVKMASVFVQLSHADQAMTIFNNLNSLDIFHYVLDDSVNVAVKLCKMGKKTEGMSIADRLRAIPIKTYDLNELVKLNRDANVAKIELFCGDAKKAKSDFKDILRRIEVPVRCESDSCGDPFSRVRQIRKIALDVGLLDLVWESKDYDDPVFNLEVALLQAKNGNATKALSRLDSLATTKNTQGNEQYHFMYPLIRAQILSLLGRNADADKEFAKARQSAIQTKYAEQRSDALLKIARAYLELKKNNQALATINEALASGMKGNVMYNPHAIAVGMLSELGSDEQAQSVALSLLDSSRLDYSNQRKEQEQGRSKILGEVALSQFQKSQDIKKLADLKAVQPFGVCLSLWLKALKIAEQRHDNKGLKFVNEALAKELDNLPTSLNVATGYPEKRQIIHLVANILRANLAHQLPEKQLQTLQLLSQQAQFMSQATEGAKALCELGYTAQKINQPALSKTLFDEGTALTRKLERGVHTFPIDEPALGACAFWLKTAGDTNQANALIDELLKKMPKNLESVGHGAIHTLLNVAIAYAEYEKGEVQWLDGSR